MPCRPSEGAFNDSAARQNHKGRSGPLDDAYGQVEESGLLAEFALVGSAVSKQMFDLHACR